MSIQSAWNQALNSIAHAKILGKITKAANKIVDPNMPTEAQMKEAEASIEAKNKEAQKQGFKGGQERFDVQTEANIAANKLKKQDPEFGFVVNDEVYQPTAFGESLQPYVKDSLSSYIKRMNEKDSQINTLKERTETLGGK